MVSILHISDLHFGPPYVPRVGDALLEKAAELQPDVVVASGDFTQRATRDQFAAARAFLDRLPQVPLVTVPGNHDVPLYRLKERWVDPHGLYKEFISSDLNQIVHVEDAAFVGLDSTAPRQAITNGRLDREQLDYCSDAFARVPPSAIRIVVAHHHFAPAPDRWRDRSMPQTRRAIDRFVELGVELILGGHLHRAYIGNSLDFFPGDHRDRGIIIVQSGTSTSRRGRGKEREKNSFNLIDIDDDAIRVTHYMYFDTQHGFGPISRHQFPRLGAQLS